MQTESAFPKSTNPKIETNIEGIKASEKISQEIKFGIFFTSI